MFKSVMNKWDNAWVKSLSLLCFKVYLINYYGNGFFA